MSCLVQLLADVDVFFIGLHCPLAELERRERQRGDRREGEARQDHATVHTFGIYDMELDSTRHADDNVRAAIKAWRERKRPSAFDRMLAIERAEGQNAR